MEVTPSLLYLRLYCLVISPHSPFQPCPPTPPPITPQPLPLTASISSFLVQPIHSSFSSFTNLTSSSPTPPFVSFFLTHLTPELLPLTLLIPFPSFSSSFQPLVSFLHNFLTPSGTSHLHFLHLTFLPFHLMSLTLLIHSHVAPHSPHPFTCTSP